VKIRSSNLPGLMRQTYYDGYVTVSILGREPFAYYYQGTGGVLLWRQFGA